MNILLLATKLDSNARSPPVQLFSRSRKKRVFAEEVSYLGVFTMGGKS